MEKLKFGDRVKLRDDVTDEQLARVYITERPDDSRWVTKSDPRMLRGVPDGMPEESICVENPEEYVDSWRLPTAWLEKVSL